MADLIKIESDSNYSNANIPSGKLLRYYVSDGNGGYRQRLKLPNGTFVDTSAPSTMGTASVKNTGNSAGQIPVVDSSGYLDVTIIPIKKVSDLENDSGFITLSEVPSASELPPSQTTNLNDYGKPIYLSSGSADASIAEYCKMLFKFKQNDFYTTNNISYVKNYINENIPLIINDGIYDNSSDFGDGSLNLDNSITTLSKTGSVGSELNISSGDFTFFAKLKMIEQVKWADMALSSINGQNIFSFRIVHNTNAAGPCFARRDGGSWSDTLLSNSSNALTVGAWTELIWQRSGNIISIWKNGIQIASMEYSNSFPFGNDFIFSLSKGFIYDEIAIFKGVALMTENTTPRTSFDIPVLPSWKFAKEGTPDNNSNFIFHNPVTKELEFSNLETSKLNIITTTGDGNSYLANDGTYKITTGGVDQSLRAEVTEMRWQMQIDAVQSVSQSLGYVSYTFTDDDGVDIVNSVNMSDINASFAAFAGQCSALFHFREGDFYESGGIGYIANYAPSGTPLLSNGAAYAAGGVFGGSTDGAFGPYIYFPAGQEFNLSSGDFTVYFRGQITDYISNYMNIALSREDSYQIQFALRHAGGGPAIKYKDDSWHDQLTTGNTIPLNTDVEIVWSRQGSTLRIFYDGTLIASNTFSGAFPIDSTVGVFFDSAIKINEFAIFKGVSIWDGNYTKLTKSIGLSALIIPTMTGSTTNNMTAYLNPITFDSVANSVTVIGLLESVGTINTDYDITINGDVCELNIIGTDASDRKFVRGTITLTTPSNTITTRIRNMNNTAFTLHRIAINMES